jgi:hypothetical protein
MVTYKFLGGLIERLFEADMRRLNGIIITLNAENKKLKRLQTDGFIHDGIRYIPQIDTVILVNRGEAMPTLDVSLHPRMEDYLKDLKGVLNEKPAILQMLARLLHPCLNHQDTRDALPECLVNFIPAYKSIPRTREPAYTIQDDERTLRQYTKLLPKIEAYSVGQLLY